MTCVCRELLPWLQRWGRQRLVYQRGRRDDETRGTRALGQRPIAGVSHDGTGTRQPGVNQLQPTLFVDAIPELAVERRWRQETQHRGAAEPAPVTVING